MSQHTVRFLFSLLLFSILPTGTQAQSGYDVGHISKSFYDGSRDRNVPTEIYYPASYNGDQAPIEGWGHPMIVFGHGFLMEWEAYRNLWEHFVPQGYVMAFPRTETGSSPDHGTFAKDLNFVADTIADLNSNGTAIFHQRLSSRWSLMGHSMGGGAAFLAAAIDSSVSTLITFAPAETSPSAIDTASSLQAPLLVLSGEKDGVTPPPDHHIPMYQAAASSCKVFINILGGAHCYYAEPNTYCDLGEASASTGISISRSEQQQITYHFVDPWMASVLQGDSTAFSSFENRLANSSSTTYDRDCSEDPTSLSMETEAKPTISIRPNPVRDQLRVQLGPEQRIADLRIHTLRGRSVSFDRLDNEKLELSDLDQGVHFLRIELESGHQKLFRFIKR